MGLFLLYGLIVGGTNLTENNLTIQQSKLKKMRVLKFGGTSVGKPERMHQIAELINDGVQKIVVLSAVSGTTNSLVGINKAYKQEGNQAAHQLIDQLEAPYHVFVKALYNTQAAITKASLLIKEKFDLLRSFESRTFDADDEKIILAQGELISTHLFLYYLQEIGRNAALIPALDFMRTEEGEPDLTYITKGLKQTLQQTPKADTYITQGYICKNERGAIDNLRRGGSDYTATLLGAASNADEIQIWTDIDGVHNNDPRIVDNTFPIEELSFAEAAELAYFGAKILHPSCVLPAQKEGVPVKLLNTMQPTAKGTVISKNTAPSVGIAKAIAAKDGITAIKIISTRMLNAYGFLKRVFEVFENYRTPIDMITTSEVAVSLTIDDDTNLESILKELTAFGVVEIDKNQTIICIVGRFDHKEAGTAVKVLEPIKHLPLRMISSGGSKSNISVLLDAKYKKEALVALHEGLFKEALAALRATGDK